MLRANLHTHPDSTITCHSRVRRRKAWPQCSVVRLSIRSSASNNNSSSRQEESGKDGLGNKDTGFLSLVFAVKFMLRFDGIGRKDGWRDGWMRSVSNSLWQARFCARYGTLRSSAGKFWAAWPNQSRRRGRSRVLGIRIPVVVSVDPI